MTAREIKIAKRILDTLHAAEGAQMHALTIHGEIGGMGFCTSAEFDATLAELDKQKLVVGIKSKFKGVMWNISDAGEAARLEM
jgi:hypothetical protein